MNDFSPHYDVEYFEWQRSIGEFGGWANRFFFEPHVAETDTVVDFGCGGGYILAGIVCAHRVGIEPNSSAREVATQNLNKVVASTAELPANFANVVISNSALEHTLRPLDELKDLYRCLKPGGRLIITVPCENFIHRYVPGDVNNHLYSWSPMALGNILTEAGFKVDRVRPYVRAWPPRYRFWARLGKKWFERLARVYGHYRWSLVIVIGHAHKEG